MKKISATKRILALLLAAIIVLGLAPMSAFAETGGYGIVTTGTDASTIVDDSGSTPKALKDSALSFSAVSGSTYVLNVVATFPTGATDKSVKVTLPVGLLWSVDGSANANVTPHLTAAGVTSGDAFTGYGRNDMTSRTYNFNDTTETVT
ncbi:MAG: hypothetical protein Q4B42_05265, partial [Oscillospiraceae bacterium]|nr:hypothetical protein [Oscillospiraceae bacterium]